MIVKRPVTGIVLSADFETMEIKIRMRPRFDFRAAAPGHEAVVLSREEYERLTTPRVTAALGGAISNPLCPVCFSRLQALKPGERMSLCRECSEWKAQS